jgi:hypothetical protein
VLSDKKLDARSSSALSSPFTFKTVERRKGTALAKALRDTCHTETP